MSHSRVRPARRGQCQYPSESMLNLGGCTYGTPEERAAWRERHVERRNEATGLRTRDPAYCTRAAKWQVDDGRHLCALHAGAEALDILRTGRSTPTEEEVMARNTTNDPVNMAGSLGNGGSMMGFREHARRVANDIAQTAEEVGGNPRLSRRYLDCSAIVAHIDALDMIAQGTYNHGDLIPPLNGTEVVLAEVRAERERQVQKGYDPSHDDGHRNQQIAHEAALAIWPRDQQEYPCPQGGVDWVSLNTPRREELIKGIALAVAEVERLDRLTALDGGTEL